MLFVDDAQIEHQQMPMLDLGIINKEQFHSVSFRQYSFRVIPGTIPAECEYYSKFCQNCLINLAGPSAKFDSPRIPGIARIPPDSGRNQWRTIKTSHPVMKVNPKRLVLDIQTTEGGTYHDADDGHLFALVIQEFCPNGDVCAAVHDVICKAVAERRNVQVCCFTFFLSFH